MTVFFVAFYRELDPETWGILNSDGRRVNSVFLTADQEESGPLTKPHLPLSATTKTNSDTPVSTPSPTAVAKTSKESQSKPVESAVISGEWKHGFCLCGLMKQNLWNLTAPLSDSHEPQPHLPVTAMTTKPGLEGFLGAKPVYSPASGRKAAADHLFIGGRSHGSAGSSRHDQDVWFSLFSKLFQFVRLNFWVLTEKTITLGLQLTITMVINRLFWRLIMKLICYSDD